MIYIDNNTTGFTIPRITNGIGDKVILINQITKRRFELSTDVLNDVGYKVDITDLKLEIGQYDYVVKKNNIPLESGILQVGGYKSQNNQYEVDFNIIQYEPDVEYIPLPERILDVTENGVYNVESFDKVDVNVDQNLSLIEELENSIAEKNQQIQTLQTENTNLQQQIEEKEGNISELEAQIEENNSLITSLQQDVDNLNQQIVDLTASILEKDDEITSLNNQINSVTTISITENGTYTPEEGMLGWNVVEVNVEGGGEVVPSYDFSDSYFYIESEEDGNVIDFQKGNNLLKKYFLGEKLSVLEYSFDGESWTSMSSVTTLTINTGERIYIRCNSGSWIRKDASSGINKEYQGLFGNSKIINLYGDVSKLVCDYKTTPTSLDYSMLFKKGGKISRAYLHMPYADNFVNCFYSTRISEILISGDISNCTNFSSMFYNCNNLTTIPQLDTSNGTSFGSMFEGCSKLTTIPQLDTSNGTNFSSMFYNCDNLTTIPQLDVSNGTNFSRMFGYCDNLTTIPQLDTSKGANFSSMFVGCGNLTTIPQLDTSNGTSFSSMFVGCGNLQNITFVGGINVNIDFSRSPLLTDDSIKSILTACSNTTNNNAKTLSFSPEKTVISQELGEIISVCNEKGWTISLFILSNEYTGDSEYFYITPLNPNVTTTIDLNDITLLNSSGFEFSFDGLTWMDFKISQVGLNYGERIYIRLKDDYNVKLKTYVYSLFNADNAAAVGGNYSVLKNENSQIALHYCKNLSIINCPNIKIDKFDKNTDGYELVRGFFSSSALLFINCIIDTSEVTNFDNMFVGCGNLTTIPQIDTSNGTSFGSMFEGCSKLTTIPQLDTSNGTYFSRMFYGCAALENITFAGSINVNIDFSRSPLLIYESVKSILTACSNTTKSTTSKTLKFNRTLTDQNSELAALISTCNSKGWTVSGLTLE